MKQHTDDSAGNGAIVQPEVFRRIPAVDLLTDDCVIEPLKEPPDRNNQGHAQGGEGELAFQHVARNGNSAKGPVAAELSRGDYVAEQGNKAEDGAKNGPKCIFPAQAKAREALFSQNADAHNAQSAHPELDSGDDQQPG